MVAVTRSVSSVDHAHRPRHVHSRALEARVRDVELAARETQPLRAHADRDVVEDGHRREIHDRHLVGLPQRDIGFRAGDRHRPRVRAGPEIHRGDGGWPVEIDHLQRGRERVHDVGAVAFDVDLVGDDPDRHQTELRHAVVEIHPVEGLGDEVQEIRGAQRGRGGGGEWSAADGDNADQGGTEQSGNKRRDAGEMMHAGHRTLLRGTCLSCSRVTTATKAGSRSSMGAEGREVREACGGESARRSVAPRSKARGRQVPLSRRPSTWSSGGRSPDSRVTLLAATSQGLRPSVLVQLSSPLTVAGPCRICTGFPIVRARFR